MPGNRNFAGNTISIDEESDDFALKCCIKRRRSGLKEGVLGGVAKFTNEFIPYKMMMKPTDY